MAPARTFSGALTDRPVVDAVPTGLNHLSVVVASARRGTVTVRVEGDLDQAGCELLEGVLTELIEGPGALTVSVDLGRAILDPEALIVFINAARRAGREGAGRFILREPAADGRSG